MSVLLFMASFQGPKGHAFLVNQQSEIAACVDPHPCFPSMPAQHTMNEKFKGMKKPTIFLSHSSANRRELLALKRLLDERAAGAIEFFLSSDEDSIASGTVWPTEVRAALDRMSLMITFASPEALKSAWTYFEAGYGLHKLSTASIYCLFTPPIPCICLSRGIGAV